MTDEIRVTVVATGLNSSRPASRTPLRARPEKAKKKTSRLLSFGAGRKEKKASRSEPAIRDPEPVHREPSFRESAPARPYQPQHEQPQYDDYYDEPATQQSQSRATPHTYHDDRVDLPKEQILESEIDVVAEIETCNACGNTLDAHTANCPRANHKPAVDDVSSPVLVATPEPEPELELEAIDRTKDLFGIEDLLKDTKDISADKESVSRGRFNKGKKRAGLNKPLAGLVTGTFVLLSIFYVVVTNKLAINDNEYVDNRSQSSTLAERKLRAANRRLTGIDQ